MRYEFKYQTTAFDMWQLSMYYMYGSIVGVCNVLFTVAMFILTIKFWGEANALAKCLMLLGCCLFTLIQPIAIYGRAKKQIAAVPQNMSIEFDDKGIHVKAKEKTSDLKWRMVKRISKKPNMIIIFSNTTHGFVLTNKVLGQQKEDFYSYLISKIENKK